MRKRSVSQLKKIADKVFSLWIRQRDKKCFTCGNPATQAGHFQSRLHSATRYNEQNIAGQCVRCNIFLHGNQYLFGERLDEVYGKGTAEKLVKEARKIKQFTTKELEKIISKYELPK